MGCPVLGCQNRINTGCKIAMMHVASWDACISGCIGHPRMVPSQDAWRVMGCPAHLRLRRASWDAGMPASWDARRSSWDAGILGWCTHPEMARASWDATRIATCQRHPITPASSPDACILRCTPRPVRCRASWDAVGVTGCSHYMMITPHPITPRHPRMRQPY